MEKPSVSSFLGLLPVTLVSNVDSHSFDETLSNAISLQRLQAGLNTHRRHKTVNSTDSKETLRKVVEMLQANGMVVAHFAKRPFAVLMRPGEQCPALIVTLLRHVQAFGVTLLGEHDLVEGTLEKIQGEYATPGSLVTTVHNINSAPGKPPFQITSNFIARSETILAHDVFYPFLKVPMEEYMKAFMEAKANVLVLVGPPGTGKSTFLRTLIVHHSEEAMLAYNKPVLESPGLMEYFLDREPTVLGLEDVDAYIDAREKGNTHMAGFLNASDGVTISVKRKKIVFSTNLPSIDKIDPALLRRGRCFDVLEFRHLKAEEAVRVCEEMKIPAQDFSVKDKWTLAEVLNPPQEFLNMADRIRKGVGFV